VRKKEKEGHCNAYRNVGLRLHDTEGRDVHGKRDRKIEDATLSELTDHREVGDQAEQRGWSEGGCRSSPIGTGGREPPTAEFYKA